MPASPTAGPAASSTPAALLPRPGTLGARPPLLSLARPFTGADLNLRASPSYLYGTTGGGEYLLHHGLDIGNPLGSRVTALADGEVIFAGEDKTGAPFGPRQGSFPEGFFGRLVVIRHRVRSLEDPLYSLYGHLGRSLVKRRQPVRHGQVIGEVGMAGIALGPHLHLEIRSAAQDYDQTYNPYLFLKPLSGEGLIIGRVSNPAGQPIAKVPVNVFKLDAKGAADWWMATTTYPDGPVRPYPALNENFVMPDLPAGRYRLVAQAGGGPLQAELDVSAGAATTIELRRTIP